MYRRDADTSAATAIDKLTTPTWSVGQSNRHDPIRLAIATNVNRPAMYVGMG
jgi:hypothetical protein